MYAMTKTYGAERGLSCCFRQHRAASHCAQLHGYALAITLEFRAIELDANNWVLDFGSLKPLEQALRQEFDHTLIVAKDDPDLDHINGLEELGLADVRVRPAVGCEAFARHIANVLVPQHVPELNGDRVWLHRVEVREHGANAATYYPAPSGQDDAATPMGTPMARLRQITAVAAELVARMADVADATAKESQDMHWRATAKKTHKKKEPR